MKLLKDLTTIDSNLEVSSLSTDSRLCKKGSMFFCIEGVSVDRHDFIEKAIQNGATVIVHSKDIKKQPGIEYIKVENVYQALEDVVDKFYQKPSYNLAVFGVTGTNGKSTMTSTLRHVLNRLGKNTGYVGTISIEYNDCVLEPTLTTPDIIEMNSILKDMVDTHVEAVSLEVSSQGLDLRRVDTLDFDVVAFTNLSLDHLDYHKTMENYYLAKKRLFQNLKKDGSMIINIDDEYGQRLYDEINHPHKYSLSQTKPADYFIKDVKLDTDKSSYTLVVDEKEYFVETNMLAMFNVYNSAQVMAMLHLANYEMEKIIEAFKDLPDVKGRVNFIEEGQNFNAVVDYSHTPDGFEKIYTYLKEITQGRLICVYGNAGGRDHSKRAIMGEISAKYCDLLIITEQDRRHEDVKEIKKEMLQNVTDTPYVFIEKRYGAIEYALTHALENDTIVVLGKGDERFQHGPNGLEEWPGDDVVVRNILRNIKDNS